MIQKLQSRLTHLLEDKDKREVLKGSAIAFALNIFSMILVFLFYFLIARTYGAEGTGLFSMGQSFLTILGTIALLGMNISTLRFIGEYKEPNQGKIISLYKTAVIFIILVSFTLSFGLYFLSDFLAISIFNDHKLGIIFQITAFILPFYAIKEYNSSFLKGFKLIKESEFIKKFLIFSLSSIFFFIMITLGKADIYSSIIMFGVSVFISVIASFFILFIKYRSNYTKYYSKALAFSKKKLVFTSFPMMLTAITLLIMGTFDKLMVGYYLDTASVGVYNIAFTIAGVTAFILTSVNSIMAPKISELYWKKDTENLQKTILFGTKIIFYLTIPLLFLIIIFSKYILGLFGEEFTIGYVTLIILVAGQLISSLSGSVGFFLSMSGNQRVFQKIVFIALIINIILNIILIPIYGTEGAAIATAISLSLWNIISFIYVKIKYRLKTYYIPFT